MKFDFWSILLIIVVVAFVAIIAAFSMSGSSSGKISNLSLTKQPVELSINGAEYMVYVDTINKNSGVAVISMQRLPIVLNKPINITLLNSNVTSINTDLNSTYANLQIMLSGISSNSITVNMQSINTSLYVPASNPSYVYTSTIPQNSTSPKASTTSLSTTIPTTSTTVNQQQIGLAEAKVILTSNSTYNLLVNYGKLYANASSCTAQTYDSSYFSTKGSFPQGGNTYQNITQVIPHALTFSISNTGPNIYLGIFNSSSDNSFTTGKVAEFVVNTATNSITSININGFFSGMNYTKLNQTYNSALQVGNSCGILIQ
jgi:hypothetical protein